MRRLDSFIGQRNNLNGIRLFLALLVMLSHCYPLTGNADGEPLSRWTGGQETFGGIAVELFFFISGLLITGSWFHSKSMSDYLRRRILRIFPGYVVGLLFSGLAAAAFTLHPAANLWRFLGKAFLDTGFLGFASTIGREIFPNNPLPGAANGSLWTISREFACYLLVAAIGLFGFFKHRVWLTMLFLAVFGYYCWQFVVGVNVDTLNCRFLTLFLAGACAWLWRDKICLTGMAAVLAVGILLFAARMSPLFSLLVPLAGGYLVLYAGFVSPVRFLGWCDRTDLSYGVYLFAFPLQQCVAACGVRNPLQMFALMIPLALAAAFLSWTFVEKPFLKLKSRPFSDRDPARTVPLPKREMPQPVVSPD